MPLTLRVRDWTRVRVCLVEETTWFQVTQHVHNLFHASSPELGHEDQCRSSMSAIQSSVRSLEKLGIAVEPSLSSNGGDPGIPSLIQKQYHIESPQHPCTLIHISTQADANVNVNVDAAVADDASDVARKYRTADKMGASTAASPRHRGAPFRTNARRATAPRRLRATEAHDAVATKEPTVPA